MKNFNDFVEANSKKLYDIQNNIFCSEFGDREKMDIADITDALLNTSGKTMIEFLRVYHEWLNE